MKNLYLQIQAMLESEMRPVTIAAILEIPVGWVYEVLYEGQPGPMPIDESTLDDMAVFYGEA